MIFHSIIFLLKVRKWGIDVQKVELSEAKILKQPENSSSTAVGSILKGLGVKGETKFPTPEEFVRASHGVSEDAGGQQPGFVSAGTLGMGAESKAIKKVVFYNCEIERQ